MQIIQPRHVAWAVALTLTMQAVPAYPQAQPRMAALAADKMTEAQAAAAKEVERNGTVPAYLWPMLRNPGLARPTQIIGEYLNRQGKLPPKLTQMAILIASRRLMYNGSWIEHSGMADRAGLRSEITQAIAAERRPAVMDEDETLIYEMCDELQKMLTISDATYNRAVARLGEAGVVDTVAIYGFYSYLGLLNNATRLPAGATPAFRPPK
jgi:4-carboxymuconolactone decarboxylase